MKKDKLPKTKIILYLSGLFLSALLCCILIVMRFRLNLSDGQAEKANYLIDFFAGVCSSIFVTVLFAFLLDQIALRESNERRQNKRDLYLNPIKMYIVSLFHSASFPLQGNQSYTIEDFAAILDKAFDQYCLAIEKISKNRDDIKTWNDAESLKNGIENYSINPMVKSLDELLNARHIVLSEKLFSEFELVQLDFFKKEVESLRLPYLNTLSKDKNTAQIHIDEPKAPINDLVKSNYRSAAKGFKSSVITLCNTFPELKPILNIKSMGGK